MTQTSGPQKSGELLTLSLLHSWINTLINSLFHSKSNKISYFSEQWSNTTLPFLLKLVCRTVEVNSNAMVPEIIVHPLMNILLILSFFFRKRKGYFDCVYFIYEEGTSKEQFNKFITSDIPTVDTVCHN